MKQTVYKSGSSLVVVVPSDFIEVVGVKKGDPVTVEVKYDTNEITYRFVGNARQLSLNPVAATKK